MQNYLSNLILGVCLIVAAFLLRPSGTCSMKANPESATAQFDLVANQGFVYRINKTNGRTDFLFPGPDGVFLIPVWQLNPASEDLSKLSEEERTKWQNILRTMSAYLNGAKVTFATNNPQQTPQATGSPAPASSAKKSSPKADLKDLSDAVKAA